MSLSGHLNQASPPCYDGWYVVRSYGEVMWNGNWYGIPLLSEVYLIDSSLPALARKPLGKPSRPNWANANGTTNVNKMPSCFKVVDAKGKPKIGKNGKARCVTLYNKVPQGKPPSKPVIGGGNKLEPINRSEVQYVQIRAIRP